jgi:hypothetical protein
MAPFRLGLLAVAGLLLASCSSPPPPPTFSDIRFGGAPPIRFDAASIDIRVEFQPTFQPPEIEQNFPIPPQRALENWVHDRMQATNSGSPNRIRVTILDASAREGALGGGYVAHAAAQVDVLDEHGLVVRTAHGEATRTKVVADGLSPDELDLAWYQMTRELISTLGIELERQIRSSFFPYVL